MNIEDALLDKKDQVIFMHRGMRNMHPENTLPAFELAREHGFHLETDVQISLDGIPFLFHDTNVARMAGVLGRIRDMNSEDVESLDAGHYSPLFRGKGYKIARLDNLLARFPDRYISIDIKDDRLLAADIVIASVLRAGATERVMIGSFHNKVVEHLYRHKRYIPVMSVMASPRDVVRYLLTGGRMVREDVLVVPNWLVKYLRLARVKEGRRLPIVSYTTRDLATMEKMFKDYSVNGQVMEGAALV